MNPGPPLLKPRSMTAATSRPAHSAGTCPRQENQVVPHGLPQAVPTANGWYSRRQPFGRRHRLAGHMPGGYLQGDRLLGHRRTVNRGTDALPQHSLQALLGQDAVVMHRFPAPQVGARSWHYPHSPVAARRAGLSASGQLFGWMYPYRQPHSRWRQ